MRKLSKLTQELALALEVASLAQAWGNPSPFQDKINELLVKAGRNPVTHLTPRALDKGQICPTCNGLKYIPALKSQPDKQCPQCKGVGQI